MPSPIMQTGNAILLPAVNLAELVLGQALGMNMYLSADAAAYGLSRILMVSREKDGG